MKFIILILIFYVAFSLGEQSNQEEIENRAKEIKQKECYSNEEIELIIFGSSQL